MRPAMIRHRTDRRSSTARNRPLRPSCCCIRGWTALPALLYPNLPLDLIEALTYGREWQLGYDKLPPLPWWLVEVAYRPFGIDESITCLRKSRCSPLSRWSG